MKATEFPRSSRISISRIEIGGKTGSISKELATSLKTSVLIIFEGSLYSPRLSMGSPNPYNPYAQET